VVPIARNDEARAEVQAFIEGWLPEVRAAGIRIHVDWREERPGNKFNYWELKGVPLRIEVGPRDVAAGQVVLVDRMSRVKVPTPVTGLARRLADALEAFQHALLQRALDFRDQNTYELHRLEDLVAHFREGTGFVWAPWCGDATCEERVKEETGGVTARAIDTEARPEGNCLCCDRPATRRVVFARSY